MNNKTAEFDFTVIVPVYNEADNIEELGRRLGEFAAGCSTKTCILFVDDGSTDGSSEKLSELCAAEPRFLCLKFDRNYGLTAALKAGFDNVYSKYAGYIDADLQTYPEDFNLLLEHIENYTMVMGIRAERHDSFFKRAQSKIANGFRRMMTGDGATDTGCPLKILHTEAAKKLPLFTGMHRFLPALILLQKGGTYKQIPVRHRQRVAGKSKFSLINRLWGPFADCFAYRWMKKRYIEYSIETSNLHE